jgi:Methyltransferase domain
MMSWTKMDLINELADIHGYRSYLEICTPTTGTIYGDLDRGRYSTSHRLMYRYRDHFDDGMAIDFLSTSLHSGQAMNVVRAAGLTYDVILVDPFHEYETSAQDLKEARDLIKPNGTIVVHDCYPEEEAFVTPHYRDGSWCGLTYKAYLDMILESVELQSCTVDTDHGCAIVRRRPLVSRLGSTGHRTLRTIAWDCRSRLIHEWKWAGKDEAASFRLLKAHAKALLNLVTVEEFLAGERNGAPVLR